MGTYQGRHALIFAAAPETDYGYIRAFLREHPDALVACADGGLRHARALGLHPDFMISDRDSMTEVEGDDVILLRPEKDDTDSQSCLREVFRRGCREATLVCATGGRIDHMLANLSLLEEAKTLGGHLTILRTTALSCIRADGRNSSCRRRLPTSRSCRWTRCSRA